MKAKPSTDTGIVRTKQMINTGEFTETEASDGDARRLRRETRERGEPMVGEQSQTTFWHKQGTSTRALEKGGIKKGNRNIPPTRRLLAMMKSR
jgi:hypothetical protein